MDALKNLDARAYPDPASARVRHALADLHGVAYERIVVAASGSEAIARITAWVARDGGQSFWAPAHAYGDYRHFSNQWHLTEVEHPEDAELVWWCDPASPTGEMERGRQALSASLPGRVSVLDCAYAPLRLDGEPVPSAQMDKVWQLWSPNKALGQTGVRGAYVIAPEGAEAMAERLSALAPSWPLGVHGEAMLLQWTRPEVQAWVEASKATLRDWRELLLQHLNMAGWTCLPTNTHFLCAMPLRPVNGESAAMAGFRLRDATSFGLPGYWRLSAQPEEAVTALYRWLIGAKAARGCEA
ncbi:histidinol-phosphate transaminase [Hydrogenophaga sp. 5NK40-0174]